MTSFGVKKRESENYYEDMKSTECLMCVNKCMQGYHGIATEDIYAVFNSISVKSGLSVHLSMCLLAFSPVYSTQLSSAFPLRLF